MSTTRTCCAISICRAISRTVENAAARDVAIAVAVTLLVSVLTAFLTGTVIRGKGDGAIKETLAG
jgi:hypothetical protein